MACATGDEMDPLQATLDFISGYDLPSTDLTDHHATSALLDLIDAFELNPDHSSEDDVSSTPKSFNNSVTSHDDASSLVASAPWPKVRPQPNKRRRRGVPRKEEIAELRKTANQLSNKLQTLKVSSIKLAESRRNGASNGLTTTLWKDIASRQLNLRKQTEEKNSKLRDDLMVQAKCSANLKRMLKRRYCEEMLELFPIHKSGVEGFIQTPTDNERIFKELLEGTDTVYTGVDALLVEKGMPQLPCPGRTHQAYPDAVNSLFFELLDKTQVPYDVYTAAGAVWKALRGRKTRDGEIVELKMCEQETQQTDDITTNHVHYACSVNGHASFIRERRAARKYVEDDRVVFVSRCLTEPTSRTLGPLGLMFRETVVIVVQKGQAMTSGREAAVIKSHLWVTRCDEGKETSLEFRNAAYTDLAIEGWNRQLSLFSERIENILLDGE